MALFTFGIVSYNNYVFIKEAVDSLLQQDYPEIELIISNDGSDDFNKQELEEYIQANKRQNIKAVHIHNNDKNLGTVKNINYICKHAQGEYLMLMAADDALYNSEVLSRFVQEFERRDDDIQVLTAKIAMCGNKLDDIRSYQPAEKRIDILRCGDNTKIFSILTYDSFMPTTSTCFKIEVLRKTGFYDEDYFIIEDAPKFISLARDGYHFGWVEDLVAARHRDGGISHGNNRNRSETYRRYRFDEILMYQKEILPYTDRILFADREEMRKKWYYIRKIYYNSFLLQDGGKLDYREYDREALSEDIWKIPKHYFIDWIKRKSGLGKQ